eukprot:CAMPEP_0177786422 /NCGR_PEP_ID=MMETSP0491_2-20121128/20914_1 /TAXON_ID=63592 /ORGANISM="Tetraselmis chuii, Strain PLY429" /LENGTH=210 /DNA_ID=CAMNT_0019307631 /DNA_START=369 /DNA_END=997 /DNA_ORIENTATION=+
MYAPSVTYKTYHIQYRTIDAAVAGRDRLEDGDDEIDNNNNEKANQVQLVVDVRLSHDIFPRSDDFRKGICGAKAVDAGDEVKEANEELKDEIDYEQDDGQHFQRRRVDDYAPQSGKYGDDEHADSVRHLNDRQDQHDETEATHPGSAATKRVCRGQPKLCEYPLRKCFSRRDVLVVDRLLDVAVRRCRCAMRPLFEGGLGMIIRLIWHLW